ncbi:hypothetical protein [Phycobacter azelaicus]|jgi:hypothetical protein|uniref:hypothetical protein n=1 Tax=Phycobacter azelaicus TaxID=2668075 RepID=UPI001866B6E4|nr:hypothetical protein [Phycobacter azelaicus]MBE1296487.1 hypothetical protein [Paracoccaceae bacterium]
MSNPAPNHTFRAQPPDDQDSLSQIWPEVFARSGTLCGFCLEWLLDRAEFDRTDFENGHSS